MKGNVHQNHRRCPLFFKEERQRITYPCTGPEIFCPQWWTIRLVFTVFKNPSKSLLSVTTKSHRVSGYRPRHHRIYLTRILYDIRHKRRRGCEEKTPLPKGSKGIQDTRKVNRRGRFYRKEYSIVKQTERGLQG